MKQVHYYLHVVPAGTTVVLESNERVVAATALAESSIGTHISLVVEVLESSDEEIT